MRKTLVQLLVLVAVATALALGANAFASRQRKLALVGWYPNATKVSVQQAASSEQVAAPAPRPQPMQTPQPINRATEPSPAPATPLPANPAISRREPSARPPIHEQPLNPAASQPSKKDVLKRFAAHPDKPYIEIAGDDVALLHGAGALFLDARRTSVYEQGHIPGARPFSVWESDLDQKVNKLFEERSDPAAQALPIVVYCSGGDCEDSHMLAQKLWGIQYNNVYVYKDGFPDWQKRGGAVVTGPKPQG